MPPYSYLYWAARAQPVTTGNYQKAAATFSSWAVRHVAGLNSVVLWDEVPAASSQDPDMQITKAMGTCKAILDGWGRMEPTRHAVPLGTMPARQRAGRLVGQGTPRMALATFLQTLTELRPGESLVVEPSHIALPDEAGAELGMTPVVIAQGVKAGIKVKGSQVARTPCEDVVLATFPGCRLFPWSQTASPGRLVATSTLRRPVSRRSAFSRSARSREQGPTPRWSLPISRC